MNSAWKPKSLLYKDDYKRFLICSNFMWLMAYRKYPEVNQWVKENIKFLDISLQQKVESQFQYQPNKKLNLGLELRIAGGIMFEELVAKKMKEKYGNKFFDCESINNQKDLSNEEKTQQTLEIIKSKKYQCLYQPYFVIKNFVTKCDFLIFNEKQQNFDLYEVKAVNKIATKTKKNEFEADLKYQCWILKQIGLKISNAYIIKLNKEYVYQLKDGYDLLWIIDDQFNRQHVLSSDLNLKINDVYQFLQTDFTKIKNLIIKKQSCFQGICDCLIQKPESKLNWLNLYRLRRDKKINWYVKNDLKEIDLKYLDINEYDLTHNQLRMIKVIQNLEKVVKDSVITKNQLHLYSYPLYFYDFESCQFAIPVFAQSSPWIQMPFQYSIHVLKNKNYDLKIKKNVEHLEFISEDFHDPRYKLIKQFVSDTNLFGKGTYISYNKSFEIGILKNILKDCELNDQEKEQINYVINHTIDLMDFFKDFNIYHSNFLGSLSIKKTYPALVPQNDGYKDLKIKSGDVASVFYFNHIMKRISQKEWLEDVEDLKKYCETDTWAMVELFHAIKSLIKK